MMRSLTKKLLLSATVGAVTMLGAAGAAAEDCVPPRILFVVDASASMLGDIGNTTKWEAAQAAIDAVLSAHGGNAEWGLMTFPAASGGCSTGALDVGVAANTAGTISDTVANLVIAGDAQTPAGQTLVTASQYAGITDATYNNYVIFVTDGYQYCSVDAGTHCATAEDCTLMGEDPCPTCSPDQPDGCYCVQDWATLGADALQAQGVNTYVVGFGQSVNVKVLNQTAVAGKTDLPGCDPDSELPSCYFQATVPAELTGALSQIVQEVVEETCTGSCGIEGVRTCAIDGWGDCVIEDTLDCQSTCGTMGTQTCVNDTLSECSSEADCGSGGGGPGSTVASSSSSSSSGGMGGAGGDTGPQDVDEESSCGCRVVGSPTGETAPTWLLGLLALGLLGRRRKQL